MCVSLVAFVALECNKCRYSESDVINYRVHLAVVSCHPVASQINRGALGHIKTARPDPVLKTMQSYIRYQTRPWSDQRCRFRWSRQLNVFLPVWTHIQHMINICSSVAPHLKCFYFFAHVLLQRPRLASICHSWPHEHLD